MLRIPADKNLNIGTWHTRSLYEAGNLANTVAEMSRLNIDILGMSKTWWPGNGEFKFSPTAMASIFLSPTSLPNASLDTVLVRIDHTYIWHKHLKSGKA